MIRITDAISIADSELDERIVRASGPGGQNVNKVFLAVTRNGTRICWPMPVEQPGSDVIHIRTNVVR